MTFALTDNGFNLFNWGAFKGMLASFLMTIVQLLCMGVFFMENVFWVLIRGVKMSDGSYRNIIDGLLFNGQSLADNKITAIVGVIVLIAIALTILASVIAVVKSNFSTKDEDRSPKIAVVGVVKAIVLMIVFPLIVYVILLITNTLTNAICQYANFDATDKNSIANQLFFMFMNPAGREKCINPLTNEFLFSFTLNDLGDLGFPGKNTWEQLIYSGFVNGANADGLFGYSYILATIVTIILIYALFKAVLMLVRRIFDITVLYVVAPLPIACYPSDEGKRYDIWKDLTASKIVSAFGLGLTFVVYSILINVLSETFAEWAQDLGGGFRMLNLSIENGELNGGSLLTLVYIFVLISGALAIPNMYNLLASLVSSQAGMVAHHDMQSMAGDLAYLQRGRQGVTRAAFGAAGLTLSALKTGLIGDRNARYALMARGGRGGANDGKVKSAALGFLAGGLIGGTASLISQGHSDRVDKKADAIRKDAIANYDNKVKLREANSELKKLKRSEVTAFDVINEEKAKQAEKAANAIAKRNRESKK